MTHNRFNVEEDLVRPLLKFLHKARLDLACRATSVTPSSNRVATPRDVMFQSSNLRVKVESNFYQNIRKDQEKFTLPSQPKKTDLNEQVVTDKVKLEEPSGKPVA